MTERKITGWISGSAAADNLRVGAHNETEGYNDTMAEVSADDDYLRIVTDENEGVVVLNIEALPFLIKALLEI